MVLTEVETGKTVKVIKFDGGRGLEGKLRQLGVYKGGVLQVVRRAPFHGPVLLSYEGREIALGFGIAKKIQVEGFE
ncbi:MAG: ferrous iron transport protein A [Anaerolineaceae bacterium]|nr:ferrous iron transport protein A [Anaerolineaceae bacterium]